MTLSVLVSELYSKTNSNWQIPKTSQRYGDCLRVKFNNIKGLYLHTLVMKQDLLTISKLQCESSVQGINNFTETSS
jgi:hypothetical protein